VSVYVCMCMRMYKFLCVCFYVCVCIYACECIYTYIFCTLIFMFIFSLYYYVQYS